MWNSNGAVPLLDALRAKIEARKANLGVIGLGYVGLAVACEFARVGFHAVGVDIDMSRVEAINAGCCPIGGREPGLAELLSDVVGAGKLRATLEYGDLHEADVVLICVDTPVDGDHKPQYGALSSAAHSLGKVLRRGVLVIVESTVSPGTSNSVVLPILEEESRLCAGVDFFIGACPERVMPGKLLQNLRTVSRVCGGNTLETAEVMCALYRQVVQAELDAADVITAELVKTAENAYRDVQIAFANEVALVCEANGADAWKVRELVNKSPGRNMLLPGAGVGGHCIPKDSWLLAAAAPNDAPLRLIPTARAVNDSMPLHVAEITMRELNHAGVIPGNGRIAVLGYAYLGNSDDTRNSPSQPLIQRLEDNGYHVTVHDPWIEGLQGDIFEGVAQCDAVVVMVAHSAYRKISLPELRRALRTPILIDGRGMFCPDEARAEQFAYAGVGRG